jgi:enediyne biosynthesis protein E5
MTASRAPWTDERRLGGLRRFAVAITLLNIFGHVVLGFEQPWIVPFVVLATAYSFEILLETVDAWACRRRARFLGGWTRLGHFLLPAHITGLAVGMLLYANERLWVLVFATAVAIASKTLLRAPVGPALPAGVSKTTRHFLNPSNFAITVTLILFPWVGGSPPYQYVENVTGWWHVVLPVLVFTTGSLVNSRFTGRMPLIVSWLAGFVLQAWIRSAIGGTPLVAALAPMLGLAFVLYTFYMITDPGTTPEQPKCQAVFGAGVALLYGLIVQSHHVFGLYYALTIVSGIRGLWLLTRSWLASGEPAADLPATTVVVASSQ